MLLTTLFSDHFCVKCHLNISKPPPLRAHRDVRKLASIEMESFKTSITQMLPATPTAEELNNTLTNVLDTHAPSTRRLFSNRPRSPWYTTVVPELLEQSKKEGEPKDAGVKLDSLWTGRFTKQRGTVSPTLSTRPKLSFTQQKLSHVLQPSSCFPFQNTFLVR